MARYALQPGPVPLHHQVYLDLSAALDGGEWATGDRLPTERELAARYGCSLITVRHALADLAREERIERRRGRGTTVLAPRIDHDFAGTMSFAEEMRQRGLTAATRIVEQRQEPAREHAAAALGVRVGAWLYYIERLRLANDESLLLEQVRLPVDRFPGLLDVDLEAHSLYGVLAERYGAVVVRAREAIEPVLLRAREARLLGRPIRAMALIVEGIAYAATGEPVELARTYVRTDRTRYAIERSFMRDSWTRSLLSERGVREVDHLPALLHPGHRDHRGREMTGPMRVALTFDAEHPDRPNHGDQTTEILALLDAARARATFFLQGRWVEALPDRARRIADAGHLVGSHSHYHARLTSLSGAGLRDDLAAAEDAIHDACGVAPRPWFRAPFGNGANRQELVDRLAAAGYRHVGWHVSAEEWVPDRTSGEVEAALVDGVLAHGDGAIVLLHTWPSPVAAALAPVLDRLTEAGATFVAVDALDLPPGLAPIGDPQPGERSPPGAS